MKISFLTGSLKQGGAERTISSLANYFAEKGHQVIIYTLSDPATDFFALSNKVQEVYLKIPNIKFIGNLFQIKAIKNQLKKDKPDWLITLDARSLVVAVFAGVKGVKVAYSERSNPAKFPESEIWKKLRLRALKKASLTVFQTEDVKNYFPDYVQKHSIVIPNAIFNESIADFKIPETRENNVSAMGRLNCTVKGFDVLVKAFSIIAPEHPGTKLRIFGHGPDAQKLTDLARECGIEDRFEIIAGNENAIWEVAKSRVFVLSSTFEGFPNALLEAMACGVPCVASDCDYGPRNLIRDGENGLLVPVGGVKELAASISRILSDENLAKNISRNAFMDRRKYSLDKIGELWETALNSVI